MCERRGESVMVLVRGREDGGTKREVLGGGGDACGE